MSKQVGKKARVVLLALLLTVTTISPAHARGKVKVGQCVAEGAGLALTLAALPFTPATGPGAFFAIAALWFAIPLAAHSTAVACKRQ